MHLRVLGFRRSGPANVLFPALVGFAVAAVGAGCSPPNPTDAPSGPVTFNRDIAPIVFKRCAVCHRPGQSGPFDLLSYADVRGRARQIGMVTQTRFMPPWLPEPGKGHFRGNRRLSIRELDLIQSWIEGGGQEGDPSDLPPSPRWAEGWQLGEPDLVLEMTEPYTLRAGGSDVFRNFVIPGPVSETRWVRGLEFRPNNARIVHHTVILVDSTGTSRRLDSQDPEPGYDGMLYNEAHSPGGHFEGWTPGKVPFLGPEDMAWQLDPGTDIVVQLHMLPTGKPELIRSSLGLFFTDRPPTRAPFMLRIGSKVIDIPAREGEYRIQDEYRLPVDVNLLSVYPHAHYLAREMRGMATLPDGTRKWLIHIADWDFNWQDIYRLTDPLLLPQGTRVEMEYTYVNTAQNPRNPHNPPRRVVYGPQSSDEMGDLWLQVLPLRTEDREVLIRDQLQRELLADIAGYEKMVREKPEDPDLRDTLAHRYARQGSFEKAIAQWQEAVRLSPGFWSGYFNLGNALHQMNRTEDAVAYYRKTIELEPEHVRSHNNLGVALQTLGRPREAIQHFRKALRHGSDTAEAHRNLGAALVERGSFQEAAVHFRRALEIGPGSVELQIELYNNLGSALAAQGRLPEATQNFGEALRRDSRSADAHSNLGNILARQGKIDESLGHLRQALNLEPESPEIQGNFGLVLIKASKFDQARVYLRQAVGSRPDWPAPLTALAWVLATHPDPGARDAREAIRLATRAARLTRGRDPRTLDVLAAAYASAGQFGRAAETASAALRLASSRQGNPLAKEIRERLAQYRLGKPHRERLE